MVECLPGMHKALVLILSRREGEGRRSSLHMLRADVLFLSNISDIWLVEYMDVKPMDKEGQLYSVF